MKKSIALFVVLLCTLMGVNPARAATKYWYAPIASGCIGCTSSNSVCIGSSGCAYGGPFCNGGGGTGFLYNNYWKTSDDGVCPGGGAVSSGDDVVLGGAAGNVTYRSSSSTTYNSLAVNTTGYYLSSYGGNSASGYYLVLSSGKLTIATNCTFYLHYVSPNSMAINVPNAGPLILNGPGTLDQVSSSYVDVYCARYWVIGGGKFRHTGANTYPAALSGTFVSDAYRLDNGGTCDYAGGMSFGAYVGLTVGSGGGKVTNASSSGTGTFVAPVELDGPLTLTGSTATLTLNGAVTNYGPVAITADTAGRLITIGGAVNIHDAPLTVGGAGNVTLSLPVSDNAATYGASGSGLLGDYYYGGTNFVGLYKAQVDSTVNFNWGTGSPESTGSFGNALVCDGTSTGYGASIPNTQPAVSAPYTVECWAKPANTTAAMSILGSRNGSSASTFDLKFMLGSRLHADIGSGSAWCTTAADAFLQYNANAWYHIAYVVTTSGYSVFVNGALVGRGAFTAGTPVLCNSTAALYIGQNGAGAEYFQGSMDEVRIWNIARTQAQIQQTMLTTLNGNESGLVGYWKCGRQQRPHADLGFGQRGCQRDAGEHSGVCGFRCQPRQELFGLLDRPGTAGLNRAAYILYGRG